MLNPLSVNIGIQLPAIALFLYRMGPFQCLLRLEIRASHFIDCRTVMQSVTIELIRIRCTPGESQLTLVFPLSGQESPEPQRGGYIVKTTRIFQQELFREFIRLIAIAVSSCIKIPE